VADIHDDELMSAVQRQDQNAYATLMHRHLDRLYGYAIGLTRHAASAEDLVQETWLRVWSNAGSYQPKKASFSTWLHRILYNLFIDDVRRAQRPRPDPIDESASDQPWQAQAESQTKIQLDRLLAQLPESQRAALLLFHQQGFSTREVAQILFLSVPATESLLARARKTLRRAHGPLHQTEE
jgi:RNA polymerase sigma-70 factor (ECF subfamily)